MRKKYVLKPRVKIFLLFLIIGYFSVVFIKQEFKIREQYNEANALKQQIMEVREKNQELERLIQYTQSDEYIEKVARERLGWVKDGEIKFVEKKNK